MANLETFDQNDASIVAHKTLPFGTRVEIKNLDNGRRLVAVVQDRGPYHPGRCVDVSKRGGELLGLIGPGTARVRVTPL